MTTKIFSVYETAVSDIRRKLERMSTRAAQYGTHLEYRFSGETHREKVFVTNSRGEHQPNLDYWTDARDVEISYELVQIPGWEPVAKIDRNLFTDRRIVTTFSDDVTIDSAWYANDMHCDHCHTACRRDTVYILRRDDGTMTQVGRSCLRDYTGIDSTALITWAEIKDICLTGREPYVDPDDDMLGYNIPVYWSVERVLALAWDIVSENGYTKSDAEGSTKSSLYRALACHRIPSDDGNTNAILIRDWLLTSNPKGNLEQNCITICQGGMAMPKHLGYLAYMPVAYQRYLAYVDEKRKRAAGSASDYVGTVGDRIQIEIASVRIAASWPTDYGMTYLWSISDKAGNVFVWRTNKDRDSVSGKTIIKGTVKDHREYDGIRQTEVTRCRLS